MLVQPVREVGRVTPPAFLFLLKTNLKRVSDQFPTACVHQPIAGERLFLP
jgi:hypothetical protein